MALSEPKLLSHSDQVNVFFCLDVSESIPVDQREKAEAFIKKATDGMQLEDQAGYIYDALRFYFVNYVPDVSAEMVSVRETRSHLLLDFIVSAVHENKGVAIKIAPPGKKVGHFISIYGYRYLAEEDNFILYFTDSDDGLYQMRQFEVVWNDANDRWMIQYLYRDYYLAYAISLARN